jgi:hypothetical protein
MLKFLDTFLPEAVGMDFTEVNFMMSSGEQTEKDKETVRFLLDYIIAHLHKNDFKYNHSMYNENKEHNEDT